MRISDWSSDGALPICWERLDQAAAEGNAAVMRVAGNGLPDEQAALARAYADFIAEPGESALRFPPGERSRRIASLGLARLAKDDPDRANALLPHVAAALGMEEAERARVLYSVAQIGRATV